MPQLDTRQAVLTDFDYCWAMYANAVRKHIEQRSRQPWNDLEERERFRSTWVPGDSHIIRYDGQEIGWFSVHLHDDVAHVGHGYISEKYQRRGIGSILLGFISEEAKRRGKRILRAEALVDDTADAFFRRNGFDDRDRGELTVVLERSI